MDHVTLGYKVPTISSILLGFEVENRFEKYVVTTGTKPNPSH